VNSEQTPLVAPVGVLQMRVGVAVELQVPVLPLASDQQGESFGRSLPLHILVLVVIESQV